MDLTQLPTQQPAQTPPEVFVTQPKPNYLKTIILSILIITTLGLITYLFFQNQKLQKQVSNPQVSPTIQVPSPTSQSISPTPKTSSSISLPPDEAVGWKMYTNTIYNYSLKYPSDWSILEIFSDSVTNKIATPTSLNVLISPNLDTKEQRISIEVEDPSLNLSLPQTYDLWIKTLKENQYYKIDQETNKNINNISITTFEGISTSQDGTKIFYKAYLFHSSDNKYFYILTADDGKKTNSITFDQILSTFKFVN